MKDNIRGVFSKYHNVCLECGICPLDAHHLPPDIVNKAEWFDIEHGVATCFARLYICLKEFGIELDLDEYKQIDCSSGEYIDIINKYKKYLLGNYLMEVE